MNLIDLFRIQFEGRAGKTALRFGDRAVTFAELDAESNRVAQAFRRMGLQHGDRVALYLHNSVGFIFAHLASLKLGCITLPLNTQYREVELIHNINDAAPRVLVTDRTQLQIIEPLRVRLPTLESLVLDEELRQRAATESPEGVQALVSGEDLAIILYTSGTTGRSKGAMLTHNNLVANITGVASAWQWTADDNLLLTLPLFHMHGLGVALHGALIAGSSIILHPTFRADCALDSLLGDGVTLFMGVPTMYVRLIQEAQKRGMARVKLPGVRLFVSGSAPLGVDTSEQFERLFRHRILERYGMTETGMNLSNLYTGPRVPGSVGVPLPGVSVRIVDEEGGLKSDGEVGEILLRGSNVFRGYWRDPRNTAQAFVTDAEGDRWFRTGDLGSRDPVTGYFTVVGRRNDLIISGGYNIYPREIEEILEKHPEVTEAAVVGASDAILGQVPVAYVVRRAEGSASSEGLMEYCREHVARYKVPREIVYLDALPRNAMGKVDKKRLPFEKYGLGPPNGDTE